MFQRTCWNLCGKPVILRRARRPVELPVMRRLFSDNGQHQRGYGDGEPFSVEDWFDGKTDVEI